MHHPARLMVVACVVFADSVAGGGAMQAPPAKAANPASKVLTTSNGVYTATQATRGEQTYMNVCVSCHPPGTYAAPAFKEKWNGATLGALFDLVSQTMPKTEPGSLEPAEYAQVIAYMLKINGAPPGKTPLPTNSDQLKKIRLHLPRR